MPREVVTLFTLFTGLAREEPEPQEEDREGLQGDPGLLVQGISRVVSCTSLPGGSCLFPLPAPFQHLGKSKQSVLSYSTV